MSNKLPTVLLTLQENGQNGGPYISHKRIMESRLSEKYNLKPLIVPRSRELLNPKGMWRFIKTIKKEKPAFVQVAGLQLEGFLTVLACKLAGAKTLLAIHGSSTQAQNINEIERCLYRFIEFITVLMADMVFGVSDYVSSWRICKYAKKHMGTVYNIANFKEPEQKEYKIREEFGIAPSDIVVVSTGRIIKDKGFDVLWDVIKKTGNRENVKYIIVGEGAYREEMLAEVRNSSFADSVIFTGYRADVQNFLQESDIFIICTKHETLCISLLEAADNGLPLIATNVGGIPEIVDDDCGFLVENEDVDAFSKVLTELIENENTRKIKGEKAKEKVANVFNEEKIVSKLEIIYKSATEGK